MSRAEKNNNYDLLRLIFALNVFFVHASVLSKSESLLFLESLFNSQIAVAGFFVVSGFFIFMSYEKTDNIILYVLKRIRRICPPYFFVVCFFAFFCFAFSTFPIQQYFSLDLVKYLIANLFFLNFLHPSLPGVFTTNPVTAVNGALWAIRIELFFYALVPLIVYLYRRTGKIFVFAAIYFLSAAAAVYLQYLEATSTVQLYHFVRVEVAMQLTYFISGALLYFHFDLFLRHRTALIICAVLVMIVNNYFRLALLEPLALSIIVIYLGSCFYYLGNFSKYGEMSYGIFILHFPILQILVSLGIMQNHPFLGLFTALILVLAGSFLCWHWIEKPFLSTESHYVSASADS